MGEHSATEAKRVKGNEFLRRFSDKSIDAQARLWKAKNIGLGKLKNIPAEIDEVTENSSLVRKDLNYVMGCLSEREKEIVMARFCEGKLMREIGGIQNFGISRQRIDQIEKRALHKLRECVKILRETGNSVAQRLYIEYFER